MALTVYLLARSPPPKNTARNSNNKAFQNKQQTQTIKHIKASNKAYHTTTYKK